MEITYDWKITALKKAPTLDGLSNVITHIRFNYTGTDSVSGESQTFSGACPVGAPSAENFSEIGTLTEEIIVEWAKANHPTDHMNDVILKGIQSKIIPTQEDVTELEWLQTVEESPAIESAPNEEEEATDAPNTTEVDDAEQVTEE
jgi:hypothetical protein